MLQVHAQKCVTNTGAESKQFGEHCYNPAGQLVQEHWPESTQPATKLVLETHV